MAGLTGDVTRFWERPQAVERLALTPEQVEKLEASHDKARPAMDKSEARMREAGEALAKALHGDTEPDIAMLRATVEEFSAAQKELMMAGVEHRASMQSILTPEQLTSLREMRQPRMRGPMMEGSPGARREGGPRALPDLPAAAPGDAPAAAPEARGRAPRDGEGQQARPPRQRREAPPAPPAPPAAPPVTE
jgi:Spy/CpxP family protein refolding chaperone